MIFSGLVSLNKAVTMDFFFKLTFLVIFVASNSLMLPKDGSERKIEAWKGGKKQTKHRNSKLDKPLGL